VVPTEIGQQLVDQAKRILSEKSMIDELVQIKKGILTGELKIGIIPTLAPYLLPLFIQQFTAKHPEVRLIVSELTTEKIISRLKESRIDVGILVTPLNETGIKEHVLFYEELVAYVSKNNPVFNKAYLIPQDIDPNKLWLLEEGHCFRSQILNLCELRKVGSKNNNLEYESGSFETLRRMVELNDGITVLPQLATYDLNSNQQQLVRRFKNPAPMREVSMVVHRDFVKKRLIDVLKTEIMDSVPDKIRLNKSKNVIAV
jgi:LysR family hydrogen peroxide-inducible transcriptional activator